MTFYLLLFLKYLSLFLTKAIIDLSLYIQLFRMSWIVIIKSMSNVNTFNLLSISQYFCWSVILKLNWKAIICLKFYLFII